MDHTTKTHALQVEDKYSETMALALRPLKGRPEVEWEAAQLPRGKGEKPKNPCRASEIATCAVTGAPGLRGARPLIRHRLQG